MSTFNVHEWNQKRRLAALDEVELGRMGAVEIAREQALHDLQDAIEKASELNAINGLEKAALDTILVRAIKRRAQGRGDLDELSNENLSEGAADIIGNGIIKIMDWAFFGIMADNEDAFNLLMDTLKDASNEEKAEMLTNLSKFLPKPTLRRLAKAELANIATRQDQLRKAFR